MASQSAANDKIRIATIGIGEMGTGAHGNRRWPCRAIELVAVCDLYEGRRTHAKEVSGQHIATTRDLSRDFPRPQGHPTPLSWRPATIGTRRFASTPWPPARMSTAKSPWCIPCEEGRAVIAAQQRTRRILQVGSQRVSSVVYQKAKDLLEGGRHRRAQLYRSLVGPQQRRGRVSSLHSAGCFDRDRGLGPLSSPTPPSASSIRRGSSAGAVLAITAPAFPATCSCALFSGIHFVLDAVGPIARLRHRRHSLLERRPRRLRI